MGDDDDGLAGSGQGEHQLAQALLARLILTGGGLVQQQDRGVHSTDAGQCHHLFCAAAETHRLRLGNGGQAELGQDLLGPGLDLILRQFQVLETVLDLIPHGGAEDLIVGVLEYIAHGFGKVTGADLANIPSADLHRAGGGAQQAVEMLGECRLAAAVLADDGHDLPLAEGKVDVLEGLHAAGVDMLEVVKLDDGLPAAVQCRVIRHRHRHLSCP